MTRRAARRTAVAVGLSVALGSVMSSAVALPTIGNGPNQTVLPSSSGSQIDASARATSPAPMIVIDPGHSGSTIRGTTTNGLRDIDYPNYPEIFEMWDVSSCVGAALKTDGYRVTLTKRSALSSVSLADRAAIANRAHAALAISVHDDHSQSASFQATYSQRGVQHAGREHPMYRGNGNHRTTYHHAAVATRSQEYATTIAAARTTAQGSVRVAENTFTGRPPLEPGNLALVQLLSNVPWVYNEVGARTAGNATRAMSIGAETAYGRGLLAGVEASVPIQGRTEPSASAVAGLPGCLVEQIGTSGHVTRPTRYLPYGWRG
ncbi:MAG: N-acetylmuramoyl-L-alanine amidase [Propionibacteriaceae bacterium]